MNVLPRRHLSRRVRHQTRPRNALLQFEDPATYDGRYHRAGGPGAWYASLTERGAWAELFRHWGQHEISPVEVRRRVGRARVTDLAVLDIIDPAVRSQLAVTEADLTGDSLATRHKSLPRRLAQTVSKGSWRLWRPRWRDHPGRLPRSDGQGGR